MDLSKLSDADLAAIASGDMSKVSDSALQYIATGGQTKPIEDPGAFGTVFIGAGRTMDRIGKGMQQLYYGAKSMFEPTGGPAQAQLEQLKRTAADDDQAYAGLQSIRPWSTGIGEALPSMVLPAGGSATLAGNMVRMGASAALPAALEYGSLDERAKRAGVAGVAGAATPLLGLLGRTAKAIVDPLTDSGRSTIASRVLNQVAGDDAANVVNRLRNATELVPGSAPTAAQVAENGGIAALERSASAANPDAYTRRAMEQATARVGALEQIAKTPADVQAAQLARAAATRPLYQQVEQSTVANTPELAALLQRMPGDAASTASRLSKIESGAGLKIDEAAADYSGKSLDYLKRALDDVISSSGQKGLGPTEKRLLAQLQDEYLSHLDTAMPAYKQARDLFASMSQPINQMQAGQELVRQLKPALSNFGAEGKETAEKYARAVVDSEGLVKRATGLSDKTLSDVLTPQQMATVNAVGQDLGRKVSAQDLGRGVGSDTFQKLAMDNLLGQAGLGAVGKSLLDVAPISTLAKTLYPEANTKMQAKLAEALLDPKKAADLMQRTDPKILASHPSMRKALAQVLLRSSMPVAPMLNAPAQATP